MQSRTVELFLALGLAASITACGPSGDAEGGEGAETGTTPVPETTVSPTTPATPLPSPSVSPTTSPSPSPTTGGEGGETGN